jgi:hypothetical protein
MAKDKLTTAIICGGSASEIIESLETALESFGLHITEHPSFEDQGDFGFIISNRKLTRAELDAEQADLETYGQ